MTMDDLTTLRTEVLAAHGANAEEIEALLAYNQNRFDHSQRHWPLADEPFVAVWQEYLVEAQAIGVLAALQQRLVQLRFPIQAGLSQSPAYQAATRRGVPPEELAEATGLRLNAPDQLQLALHPSPAGPIPLLITAGRADFTSLVQALTRRNEPDPLPDSMGAAIVAGYTNWDRIHRYRQSWEKEQGWGGNWAEAFKALLQHKALYQDTFIILSDGPYSGVSAAEMGLSPGEWRRLSLIIRREHECTHYFTRRVFNSMQNNLIDELLADYMGLVAALGRFQAGWFLGFMGLEAFPLYRQGGRLQNYRSQPPLSEGAFKILQALVKSAAENLEALDTRLRPEWAAQDIFLALTHLTLEEIASEAVEARVLQACRPVTI
jgi:hypothetical protein